MHMTEATFMNQINVYGSKGVGKTRLVAEVSDYLRYRYYFGAGFYTIDLSKVRDSE